MEDRGAVPRRIPSLHRNRKAELSSSISGGRSPAEIGVGLEHGHNSSDVYGVVGYVTVVAATVVFVIWAYVPAYWLHSIGIYYYPSRYWALSVPGYVLVTTVLAIVLYTGLDLLATPPPTSLKSIFEECSEEPLSHTPTMTDDEQVILTNIPVITDDDKAIGRQISMMTDDEKAIVPQIFKTSDDEKATIPQISMMTNDEKAIVPLSDSRAD